MANDSSAWRPLIGRPLNWSVTPQANQQGPTWPFTSGSRFKGNPPNPQPGWGLTLSPSVSTKGGRTLCFHPCCCLWTGYLKKLWPDSDETRWTGWVSDENTQITFWFRSESRSDLSVDTKGKLFSLAEVHAPPSVIRVFFCSHRPVSMTRAMTIRWSPPVQSAQWRQVL